MSRLVILLPLMLVLGAALVAWPFTVDDAFIVASYARQLATHGRYSLDGVAVSDGVTSPLWLSPLVVAELAGISSVAIAKCSGLLCAVCALWLVLRRMRVRQGSSLLVFGASALSVCQSDLAIWSVGGLETGAATLALAVAATSATKTRMTTVDHGCLGMAIGSLAWLRPELLPAAAVMLACAWIRDQRRAWLAVVGAGLGVVSVAIFRMMMFGHVLPLSVHAKPAELANGSRYVLGGTLLITGVVGVVLFARGMAVGRVTDRWVGVAVIVLLVSVLLAGGDWMPGFRLLVPVIPLYAWVAAVGATRFRRRWLGTAMVLASCALPLVSLVLQLPRARASGDDRQTAGASLARWLEVHACRVALVDVGYLVYAARLQAVDLAGITDASIAALPGGHVSKRIPVSLVMERDPDTIILRGRQLRPIDEGRLPADVEWHSRTEHELAQSKQIASRYRPVHVVRYAERYVYYVLSRDGAQSCPTR